MARVASQGGVEMGVSGPRWLGSMGSARAIRRAGPDLCYDIDSLADFRYAVAHAAQS